MVLSQAAPHETARKATVGLMLIRSCARGALQDVLPAVMVGIITTNIALHVPPGIMTLLLQEPAMPSALRKQLHLWEMRSSGSYLISLITNSPLQVL